MKKIMVLFVVLVVAFLGISSVVTAAQWTKLPADLKIIPPKAGIPGAEFSGKWDGSAMDLIVDAKVPPKNVSIVFTEIKADGVQVIFATDNRYESVPGTFPSGDTKRVIFNLTAGVWKGATVTCALVPDNKLEVNYTIGGRSTRATLYKDKKTK
jgi:hypothetical protein